MVGVPSTYTPEIGAAILKHMEDGYSLIAAAAHVNVGARTVYDWMDRYPEFKALYDVAKAKRQLWWETDLKNTSSGARVTAGLKALGGMRSPDWSDDSRIELTGAEGAPLINNIAFTILDPRRDEPARVIEHEEDDG